MQTNQPDRLISSYKAAQLLGIDRRTLLDLGLPHLEIKRRDRVLRRYRESVISEFVKTNSRHEQPT
ncbi:MAG: hypothetical protein BWK73_41770 [Thiothrix lacustris]|uniref:DNA-binding protein n=1 Tax=Thiothrix lacustris TaxID=525917 RepID=A0A1Y1QD52_9GAMM|nr:MAG: hypothetical protein BWK73_41770 [Thiothrix lacustris]